MTYNVFGGTLSLAQFQASLLCVVNSTTTMMCACGETGSCGEPGLLCHCDKNDDEWRQDEGYITNRPDLPVRGFCAGDTGKYVFHQ